jgi:hypothetical protein
MAREFVDLEVLKSIGFLGEATKYDIEKRCRLAHGTVFLSVERLKSKGLIEEVRREKFSRIEGLSKVYYKLSFKGALLAMAHIEKKSELEKFIKNNHDKWFFDIISIPFMYGAKEVADFLLDVVKQSIKSGFINPSQVSELDAKLLLSIFLLKKCKEKQKEFIEKAKEKSPLQKYYQILQTIGSLYDEEIILHSEKTEKVLEQMMKIVQTDNFKRKV